MEHFAAKTYASTKRILVAEEDPRLRRIVCLNLEQCGLDPVGVSSATECRTMLHEGDVGAVIISPSLPGFEAQLFSLWLRSEFPGKAIPVVVISFEPEDKLLTLPLRLAAFRRKPFDPGDLVGQVATLMQTA